MSTRWYPIYQTGNPQLRVFLPNFWMKLVKPESRQPSNIVTFHCSMEMTKFDVANYLSKIYDVHAISVRTRIKPGDFVVEKGRVTKKLSDVKVAYVTLEANQSFEFPSILEAYRLQQQDKEDKLISEVDERGSQLPKDLVPGQLAWFDAYHEFPTKIDKKK